MDDPRHFSDSDSESDSGLSVDNEDPIDKVEVGGALGELEPPFDGQRPLRRGAEFYVVLLALCVSSMLSAVDMMGLGTALPTIAADLKSEEYAWIGSAFALAATAVVPICGSLASIVGRRATLLGALLTFAVGSAVCGGAPNMATMIAGRAIQGAGGGSIIVMTEIVVVDLVPLAERGVFFGIIGATWSLSAGVGPLIAGVLAQRGQWRWFFFLNLPILAAAFVLVAVFLDVKTPRTTFGEKLAQIDWVNLVFVASTSSAVKALSWAGDIYPWSSWRVIVPLTLGLLGIGLYIWVEKNFVKRPTIPFEILRVTWLGYLTTFIHGMTVLAVVYYLPTYYQACRGASPVGGGIDLLSLSFTLAPFGMIAGLIVTMTTKYQWLNVAGWVLTTLGLGLMGGMIRADSPTGFWIGFPVLFGCGAGILFGATLFPILAPLDLDKQPPAMIFHAFTRLFGNTWGISIGITVLQDQLKRRLPAQFLKDLGRTTGIAYAAIPTIPKLPEPLQTQVKEAYAGSLSVLWLVLAGFAALGLFASLFIEELPLAKEVDVTWGLDLPHPPSPPDSPRPSSLHPRTSLPTSRRSSRTSLPTSRRSSLAVLPETFRRRSSVATHWPPLEVPLGRRPSSTTELEAPAVGGRRRSSVERIVSFAHWMVGAGVPVAEALGALGGRERRGSAETRRSGSKRREPSLAGY